MFNDIPVLRQPASQPASPHRGLPKKTEEKPEESKTAADGDEKKDDKEEKKEGNEEKKESVEPPAPPLVSKVLAAKSNDAQFT